MHRMRDLARRNSGVGEFFQISPFPTCCTSWHVGVEFSNRNSAYEEMQHAVQCLGTRPKVSQTGSSKSSKKKLYVEPRLRWAAEGVGLALLSRGSHHATCGRQSGERWDGCRLLTHFARFQRVTSRHVGLATSNVEVLTWEASPGIPRQRQRCSRKIFVPTPFGKSLSFYFGTAELSLGHVVVFKSHSHGISVIPFLYRSRPRSSSLALTRGNT